MNGQVSADQNFIMGITAIVLAFVAIVTTVVLIYLHNRKRNY